MHLYLSSFLWPCLYETEVTMWQSAIWMKWSMNKLTVNCAVLIAPPPRDPLHSWAQTLLRSSSYLSSPVRSLCFLGWAHSGHWKTDLPPRGLQTAREKSESSVRETEVEMIDLSPWVNGTWALKRSVWLKRGVSTWVWRGRKMVQRRENVPSLEKHLFQKKLDQSMWFVCYNWKVLP